MEIQLYLCNGKRILRTIKKIKLNTHVVTTLMLFIFVYENFFQFPYNPNPKLKRNTLNYLKFYCTYQL